ncbi:MAG: glycosyltransferase family 39 protein [Chloroflexota bacterium]|nr:glycosyltransferase family 39 protein [Chloroflexota bacterium]
MVPIALFAAAFLVRAIVGLIYQGPAYPDSYYYVNVAQQLAAGNGFQLDYIWNFVDVGGRLPDNPTLPIASNAHWMPLASLVQVPFIWLLGAVPLAFGLPFWIVGALAAPLTWMIGRDAGLGDRTAVAGGLLVALPAGMTPWLSQPDNFGLFMTLGALALWLCARGLRGDRKAFVLGGLVVGLATLARNDGFLLGAPFALAVLNDLWRKPSGPRIGLSAALACAGLFALVMAPWWLRQLEVFGSISPSAASGRILWISDYRELYSISGEPPTPASLLAQGIGPLVASRVGGLLSALALFAFIPLLGVFTPLWLVGIWQRRHDPAYAPFFVYGALLFAASALLFAVHVPYGTFLHSAVALLPHSFLLVLVGLGAAVDWVARRRASWDRGQATAVFTVGAIAVAAIGGAVWTAQTTSEWTDVHGPRSAIVDRLRQAPESDHVMSADPGAIEHLAGRGGIVTPDDPLPVIEEALRAYDIRWLALERHAIVPALAPLLLGEERPAWLSAPVVTVADPSRPEATRAALYAVCFSAADRRCAP